MLSPSEFFVGNVGSAKPLSLILPTGKYDETMLVGHVDGAAAAVFLSGTYKSIFIESAGNDRWRGLIIPDVRIEVDETSVVGAGCNNEPFLSVVRTDKRLVIPAQRDHQFGASALITLHDDLASAGEFQAIFSNWQVVVGTDQNVRVLWSTMDSRNP